MSKADCRLQTEGMDLTGCLGARDARGGGEVNLEQIFVPDRCGRERFRDIRS